MEEIWYPCKGYEERYLVSNTGKIASRPHKGNGWKLTERECNYAKKGYKRIRVFKNGQYKTMDLHRLIAETFIDNPNNLPCVHHINGDKSDNRVENLEWVEHFDNIGRHYSQERTKKYGVTKKRTKWKAQIKVDGKNRSLGSFETKEEAYQAFYEEYLRVRGVAPWIEE